MICLHRNMMISSLPSSEENQRKICHVSYLWQFEIAMKKRNSIFFIDKWWFPEIGLPPSHPFIARIFQYKPSSYWGLPMYGTPQIIILIIYGHYQRAKRQDPSALPRPPQRPPHERVPVSEESSAEKATIQAAHHGNVWG